MYIFRNLNENFDGGLYPIDTISYGVQDRFNYYLKHKSKEKFEGCREETVDIKLIPFYFVGLLVQEQTQLCII